MTAWVAVGVATAIAVVMRAAFVVGSDRLPVPAWLDRVGAYVAPAMTAALLAPHVLGGISGAGVDAEMVAVAAATPVALRTHSVGWTLAVGMPIAWIVRALS